jgi:predicted Zn-dependent protease
MSSITISPAPAFAREVRLRPQARSVRLTRRGRMVFLMAFLAVAAALMIAFGGLAGASLDAGDPEQVRIVEVGAGDTLYQIAADIAEPGQIREAVAHIQQLNGLNGPELQIGQRLAVPVE